MKFSMFSIFTLATACGGAHITSTDIEKDQVNARLALGIYNEVADGGAVNPIVLKVKTHAIFCNEQGELARTRSPMVDGGPPCK